MTEPKQQKESLYDTPVKRLLNACGLSLVSKNVPEWYVNSNAWKRLQKYEEEHGNDF